MADGWAIDVVREIERRVGETAKIRVVPWARAYHAGLYEPNVAFFLTVHTEGRAPLFQWVGPIQTVHLSFYGRPGDSPRIASLDDARTVKSVGVPRQFAADEELTRLGFANLDRVERPSQMVEKLLARRNEIIASDDGSVSAEALRPQKLSADDLEKLYEFAEVRTYVTFSKSTPAETVQAWQKALDDMRADGTFTRLSGGVN